MYKFSNPHARHIETDLDLVFVTKLSLPPDLQAEFDQLSADSYEWRVSTHNFVPDADFHNGHLKVCSVFTYRQDPNVFIDRFNEELFKLCWQEFLKIDPDAELRSVVRGLASWANIRGRMTAASPHHDGTILEEWSFLVHLKGASGTTNFFDNEINRKLIKTVDFEPLRLMIFPSVYQHQGMLPLSREEDRIVVNYIGDIKTSLNDRVLLKSPQILQKIAAAGKENAKD